MHPVPDPGIGGRGNDPYFLPLVPTLFFPAAKGPLNPAEESGDCCNLPLRTSGRARSPNAFLHLSQTIASGYNILLNVVQYNFFKKVADLQLLLYFGF